jgi:L-lactate utilization protein LutC
MRIGKKEIGGGGMSTSQRTGFLGRLAAAVRAGHKYREASQRELPPTVGYLGAGDDLIGRLADELCKVGAEPIRVQTREAAVSAIRAIVERFAVRHVVSSAARILDDLGLVGVLRESNLDVATTEELAGLDDSQRRDRLFAAELGIAAPDWAIAETGTLVYASGPAQTRSATLLPPIHLAVVDATCVLPDLLDLPARLAEHSAAGVLPRNVALVTGPSKTGDIELKLTTGVHGPGEVHVLIWDR